MRARPAATPGRAPRAPSPAPCLPISSTRDLSVRCVSAWTKTETVLQIVQSYMNQNFVCPSRKDGGNGRKLSEVFQGIDILYFFMFSSIIKKRKVFHWCGNFCRLWCQLLSRIFVSIFVCCCFFFFRFQPYFLRTNLYLSFGILPSYQLRTVKCLFIWFLNFAFSFF